MNNLKLSTRLYGSFGIVIALTVILQATALFNFSKLADAVGWNTHTYEVITEMDTLLISLVNIETGERGFAITGNDSSLEPLTAGVKDTSLYTSLTDHRRPSKNLFTFNDLPQPL